MTRFLDDTIDLPTTADPSDRPDRPDRPDHPDHPGGAVVAGTSSASESVAATVADVICVVSAAALVLILITDYDTPVRPAIALVFSLFVPGWTLVRLSNSRGSLLGAMGGVALSISIMILLGQALVLWGDWKWFPAGIVLGTVCAVLGTWSIRRRQIGRHDEPDKAAREPAVFPLVARVSLGSVVAGNVLVVVGLRHSSVAAIDYLGVVDILSAWYWLGLAAIVGGLVFACWRGSRWAWLNVTALLFGLHGLPGMLQPNSRFSVAWIHAGFARHIAEQGTLHQNLDARFSWAGFFSGSGLLQRFAGTESLLWLVRYAPLFYNACSILLVALLARRLRSTEMQAVAAAAVFCCLNWIGQDYFAPQATGFVLYLTVVTVTLFAFPADPAGMPDWSRRLLRPQADPSNGIHGRQAVAVLGGCCAVVVAIVVSHQLTPAFLISALSLLVVFRVSRLRVLPIFVAAAFLAWMSFGADAYWRGHFDTLTGSIGQVGNLVSQNVGKRAASTVFERQVVVWSRIVLTLVSWGMASILIALRRLRGRTPVALACLFVAPFPMLVLQPYGGEMALRVCLFTLPAVAILFGQMLVPAAQGPAHSAAQGPARATGDHVSAPGSPARFVAFGVVLLLLIPVFVTARFGNESFESYSDNDVRLSERMYDIVPDGSIVYVDTKQSLLYWKRVADVRFRNLPVGTPTEVTDELTTFLDRSPVFVMLSESQAAYGIVSGGRSSTWMNELISELILTGRYQIVAQFGGGVLLELEPQ